MKQLALVLLPLLALSACSRQDAPAASDDATAAAAPAPSAAGATPAAVVPAEADSGFSLERLAISEQPLGEFPYLHLPDGYQARRVIEKRFDRLPFWTGEALQWVQGRVWSAGVHTPGKTDDFSLLELQANLDAVIAQAGGHLVTRSVVPPEAVRQIEQAPGDILVTYNDGLAGIFGQPVSTWVIRRADHDIWIYLGGSGFSGGLTIVQTQAVAVTAGLLPAAALEQALARDGKVAIEVNFASDSAQILPASQAQIAQVARLLSDAPTLALVVHGHTDNSGDAAHNLQLSRQRAASVVSALAASGVDAGRLQAEGFGDTRPVADNGSEAGKARNRRVELVKR